MKHDICIDLSQLLLSVSMALDAVEEEVLGTVQNHGKRVALLSARAGELLGLRGQALADLAGYALLHDNALTEYYTLQQRQGKSALPAKSGERIKEHCVIGERNLAAFPIFPPGQQVILYHHENYDGSGFFGVSGEQIPLMARILRAADNADLAFPFSQVEIAEPSQGVRRHLRENAGRIYDPSVAGAMDRLLADPQTLTALHDQNIHDSVRAVLPPNPQGYSYEKLLRIGALFGHIVDYKSPFTARHSSGIAEKARRMADFYDFDRDTANQLHLAALLHDVGKLATPNALLEKPGRLTDAEYEIVKGHVHRTHEILSAVDGFETIARWASSHHERLDGSGYFRGSTADEQDFCSRLLACIDIFQALVEDRPYRAGMHTDKALTILRMQAEKGMLDSGIVDDLAEVYCDETEKTCSSI